MQYRFLDLEFPVPWLGFSLGYIGVFIIIYILAYVIFKRSNAGCRLPPAGCCTRGGPGPAPGPEPALIRPQKYMNILMCIQKCDRIISVPKFI